MLQMVSCRTWRELCRRGEKRWSQRRLSEDTSMVPRRTWEKKASINLARQQDFSESPAQLH
ncbi:hypothetical protein Celaphus_00002588 [Cervus elaphus hippelaphus]|uniref:Uncharacterized protein n=1 Tax=Cervus elaphus hippelaphus TaxID=46360 RepID=A0A212CGJ0_CEREH|nr:hypothetical protein Celaphus_00002588 [Cervus elaphus hippelaphus]